MKKQQMKCQQIAALAACGLASIAGCDKKQPGGALADPAGSPPWILQQGTPSTGKQMGGAFTGPAAMPSWLGEATARPQGTATGGIMPPSAKGIVAKFTELTTKFCRCVEKTDRECARAAHHEMKAMADDPAFDDERLHTELAWGDYGRLNELGAKMTTCLYQAAALWPSLAAELNKDDEDDEDDQAGQAEAESSDPPEPFALPGRGSSATGSAGTLSAPCAKYKDLLERAISCEQSSDVRAMMETMRDMLNAYPSDELCTQALATFEPLLAKGCALTK